MPGKVIRIGLLGASKIAVPAVIGPAADIAEVEVTAVAARDAERAASYAAEHGIANVVADYAALVTCDDVDLIYNGLPPSEHMEWSIAAMANGKDVLCEKPFALNAAQAERMVEEAGKYGRTISFFCHMQRLTNDEQYRRLAREVAAEAISRLYYKGMFRGHPAKPYYESIDDVGDLLLGLVELHELTAR